MRLDTALDLQREKRIESLFFNATDPVLGEIIFYDFFFNTTGSMLGWVIFDFCCQQIRDSLTLEVVALLPPRARHPTQ